VRENELFLSFGPFRCEGEQIFECFLINHGLWELCAAKKAKAVRKKKKVEIRK
jgi:hypothetical protein